MQPQEQESSQFRVPEGPARKAQQQQSGTGSPTKAESSSTITTSKTTTTISVTKTTTTSSSATDHATDIFRATPEIPRKFRPVPQYVKPTASQVEQYDSTQTQVLGDFAQDLLDDEEQAEAQEKSLPFGRLDGRDETMHCYLTRAKESFTFGISSDNDFIITHQHWSAEEKEAQDTWFRVSWKPSTGNSNQVLTTVHGVSSTGVYINGKLLGKGASQLLQWTDVVTGGPPGKKLFEYTYTEIKRPVTIETARATYVLEDALIGEGQFAKVHRARDTAHNDMMYACKVINFNARVFNDSERACIAHEIDLLQELSHENIVKFIEVHSAGPMTYIFTELIDGVTLHTYYQDREPPKVAEDKVQGLTEEEARSIFRQTCDAVCYLHSHDVVHRDIKSDNVMITPEGVVKLIDFGLARRSTSTAILHTFCGTEAYMAPEVFYGEEANGYGKAVDIWSLGVMLFRMLAGSYPFEARKYENGDTAKKDGSTEAKGDTKEKSDAETNMQGVERQEKVYPRRPPLYQRDWRPFVDNVRLRSDEVKGLLEQMLAVDPSKRISIADVLRHDWVRMINVELAKIEEKLAEEALSSVLKPKPEESPLWIELTIVRGSVPDAPRRIGLLKHENELILGRDPFKVGVALGNDDALSSVHCQIVRDVKENIVMVYDMSENGTYINSQKIGLDRGLQLLDGDELGLIVPLDPILLPDARDRVNRYLKYKVQLKNSTPTTEDLVRRRYVADDKPGPKTERRLIRKGEALDIPPANDFPSADNAWGKLEPINGNSAKETLSLKKNVIGRWQDCDIIIANNLISRYHCVFEWNEEHRAAYLSSKGQNVIKVNGSRVHGHMQLRDNDVIHLTSPKTWDESTWIGYTFHYIAQVELPRFKRIKEEK